MWESTWKCEKIPNQDNIKSHDGGYVYMEYFFKISNAVGQQELKSSVAKYILYHTTYSAPRKFNGQGNFDIIPTFSFKKIDNK